MYVCLDVASLAVKAQANNTQLCGWLVWQECKKHVANCARRFIGRCFRISNTTFQKSLNIALNFQLDTRTHLNVKIFKVKSLLTFISYNTVVHFSKVND